MLMDAKGIIRRTEDILRSDYQININEADAKQLHRALSDMPLRMIGAGAAAIVKRGGGHTIFPPNI